MTNTHLTIRRAAFLVGDAIALLALLLIVGGAVLLMGALV